VISFAVVLVVLPADDVVPQLHYLLPVRVQSLHASGQAAAAVQVEVLERGAEFEQTRKRLQTDRRVAQVDFSAITKWRCVRIIRIKCSGKILNSRVLRKKFVIRNPSHLTTTSSASAKASMAVSMM
jgi:hypothetical protein